jgi:hypothetical protein
MLDLAPRMSGDVVGFPRRLTHATVGQGPPYELTHVSPLPVERGEGAEGG